MFDAGERGETTRADRRRARSEARNTSLLYTVHSSRDRRGFGGRVRTLERARRTRRYTPRRTRRTRRRRRSSPPARARANRQSADRNNKNLFPLHLGHATRPGDALFPPFAPDALHLPQRSSPVFFAPNPKTPPDITGTYPFRSHRCAFPSMVHPIALTSLHSGHNVRPSPRHRSHRRFVTPPWTPALASPPAFARTSTARWRHRTAGATTTR